MSVLRLRRLRLRDFRGVDDAEVRFPDVGVTIVVGPNEVGKSSLAEALDLVLDELDRTAKACVREIKPVHRDVGPEVEVDLLAGPYDFTLSKRFLRKPETRLTIRTPRPENLTGDEAHQRVRAILRAETDEALFRALRIHQGSPLDLPSVAGSPSLAAALDRAAGGDEEAGDEGNLFARATTEFQRYFTPQGQERKGVLGDGRDAIARDRADADRLVCDLGRLESDIERAATLAEEIVGARASIGRLRDEVETAERDVVGVTVLRGAVATRSLALAAAVADQERAGRAQVERERLMADADAARAEVARLTAASAPEAESLARAEEAYAAAQAHLASGRTAREVAADVLALRRADVEAARDAADLAGLRDRRERADAATEAGRAARARLDASRVDDAALAAIDAAHLEEERAAARLTAGVPVLRLRAHAAIEPVVDGTPTALAPGDSLERTVSGSLTVDLSGVAEVHVEAGSSASDLIAAVDAAHRRTAGLCAAAGVPDRARAVAAHADRRLARADLDEAARAARAALGDLTPDALAQRIASLEERLDRHAAAGATLGAAIHAAAGTAVDPAARVAVDAAAGTAVDPAARVAVDAAAQRPVESSASAVDEAGLLLAEAEKADAAAAGALAAFEAAAEVARSAVGDRRLAAAERGAFIVAATEALGRAEGALATARAANDDAVVGAALARADVELAAARTAHDAATAALDAANPTAVDLLAANARASLRDAESLLHDLETEFAGVRAGLQVRGEEGLKERLDDVAGRIERAEVDLAGVARRAAAAQLLFTTLRDARDEANRRYATPLRTRIVELGRVVFGPDFSVELRDDLTVESRTLGSRTIPWGSLSGGAKEQLAILVRLAAASIVADSGGVPVILDDVLGYSDPARLQTMGALLAEAGRTGQVIVLTCFPERYAHVGGANRVRLGEGNADAAWLPQRSSARTDTPAVGRSCIS